MAFSASLRPNLSTTSPLYCFKLCPLKFNRRRKRFAFFANTKSNGHSFLVNSVLNNGKSNNNTDSGATQPARFLLGRMFTEAQKLEEQMSRYSHIPQDIHSGLNLEILESDLQAALKALKIDDLHDAERMIMLEPNELERVKKTLKQRERDLAAACSKQEKLKEELKLANLEIASQARQIEYLKHQVKERDQEITAAESTLSLKEDEMDKMRNQLIKKSEEVAKISYELKSKSELLNEANKVVNRQHVELQELRRTLQVREEELKASMELKKLEEEKVKGAESSLKKRTKEWLLSREELKNLAEEASNNNEALEEFRRVKKLLSDVRSELISSQKSLASSRQKMAEQEQLFKTQMAELEQERASLISYMTYLKDAQIEVESEKVKLRLAEARNKELERDLLMEKKLMEDLQEKLKKERDALQQATQEKFSLQEQLDKTTTEFGETENLLQAKESELVEAKLEIQRLKSEQTTIKRILEEKDLELLYTREMLEEVNQEVAELKKLTTNREEQLIQATDIVKEKDEFVQVMQDELTSQKLKVSETQTVVERIVDLTSKLVTSAKDDELDASTPIPEVESWLIHQPLEKRTDLRTQQLEKELELTKESLRTKEMEVLASRRALTIKEEMLKTVLGKLEAREHELAKMKEMAEDANDLRNLYLLAQKRIGERTVGDLAIEKLQLEAAQLEAEAAASALHKLTDMTHQLLNEVNLSMEGDTNISIFPENGCDPTVSLPEENECFNQVKAEVMRLSALSEKLLKEAGLVDADP